MYMLNKKGRSDIELIMFIKVQGNFRKELTAYVSKILISVASHGL